MPTGGSKMLNPKATIALMICCRLSTFELQAQSMPIQNRVESLIDSWEGRPTARESLLKVGSEPEVLKALGAIAASSRQPFMRRRHAIGVLATFKSDQSVGLLARVAESAEALYRCDAIQALAEIATKSTVPVLVGKLDDHSVCMQFQFSDPASTADVYVSDEAVRALESVTGQTFGQKSSDSHRVTNPWKSWWAKQQRERVE